MHNIKTCSVSTQRHDLDIHTT